MNIFRRPFTLRRKLPPKRVGPRFEEQGIVTESIIFASLQPNDGKEMQSLPEGRRFSEYYDLYTSSPLNTVSVGGANPDVIVVEDVEFEIVKVENWANNIINHYRALIARPIESPGSSYVPIEPPAGYRITALGNPRITTLGADRIIANA